MNPETSMDAAVRGHGDLIDSMVRRGNGKISPADTLTLITSIEKSLKFAPKTILGSKTAQLGFIAAMRRYHENNESDSDTNEVPARPGLRVTMMVGQTGSGKSTYAASLANGNDVIVSSDVLKSSRPRIDAAIRAALKSGKSVIVDATNPTRERRQEIARIARHAGAATRCVHVDTERSVATARSGLGDKTRYIAASQFHKRFEALGDECNTATRVSGNDGPSSTSTKNTARPNVRVIESQNAVNSLLNTINTPEPKRQRITAREFQKNVQAMLAEKYKNNGTYNLSRYYASEKMDGMRALFDGTKLVSRNGKPIAAPGWFLAEIPNGTYDGELFAGRGFAQFQSVISIAKKSRPVDAEWKTLQYRIFDDPASATPFETTLARLRRELPTCDTTSRAFVCLQPQRKVSSQANLNAMFKGIKAMGGEGIMLRNAAARYAPGTRSKTILKVKNVQDAEAVITDFELRPDGALKSLIVQWALGGTPATFHVGSGLKESERVAWRTLFRKGDLVTVQYAELTTTGKARFPVFKAVRTDINRPNLSKTNMNNSVTRINAAIDLVISAMKAQKVGPGAVDSISFDARQEVIRVVSPLYRGAVADTDFGERGLVTKTHGNTPLHVIETLLYISAQAARRRPERGLSGTPIIEKIDVQKAIAISEGGFNFA